MWIENPRVTGSIPVLGTIPNPRISRTFSFPSALTSSPVW